MTHFDTKYYISSTQSCFCYLLVTTCKLGIYQNSFSHHVYIYLNMVWLEVQKRLSRTLYHTNLKLRHADFHLCNNHFVRIFSSFIFVVVASTMMTYAA